MYIPDYGFRTIKDAQLELLVAILENGDEVENLLEINNVSMMITKPLEESDELYNNITKTGRKHLDQMLLKPNPELVKTHYARLHDWHQIKDEDKITEEISKFDQVKECIERLRENPFSKRCVMTLWSPEDINDPYAFSFALCQLLIRNNKLIITSYFRGIDAYNAMPFNCLGIAKLQEEIANTLGVETGEFVIHIGSCHIYKSNTSEIKKYLNEN